MEIYSSIIQKGFLQTTDFIAAFAGSVASALPFMLLDGEWQELEGGQMCRLSQHADIINASLTMSVLATMMR